MADKKLVGGGEHTLIYRVKSDFSAVVQADGTTTATTNAHATLELTTTVVKPTLDVAGGKFTINSIKVDTLVQNFLDDFIDEDASDVSPETIYGEAGTKHDSTSAGSGDLFLVVYAGGTNADGRMTVGAIGTLDASSANFEAEYNKHTVTNLVFNLVKADVALAVVNGLLPTGKYGVGATFTIAQYRKHWKGFLAV